MNSASRFLLAQQFLDMLQKELSFVDVQPDIRTHNVPLCIHQTESIWMATLFDTVEKKLLDSYSLGVGEWCIQEKPTIRICLEGLCVFGELLRCVLIRIHGDTHEANRLILELVVQQLHLRGLPRATSLTCGEKKACDVGLAFERLACYLAS